MVATLIPVYPLALLDGGWRPTPELYFTDNFLLALHNEPGHETCDWKINYSPGSALWLTSARGTGTASMGVIITGTICLRYAGHQGTFVWRLTNQSHEHLGSGQRVMKGVWPD